MRTVSINTFNGGMTNEPRDPREAVSRLLVHFDSYTYPHKLVPYHSSENGDTSSSTNKIGAFCFANNLIYGLSFETGSSQKLYAKNDNTTQTWSITPANINVSAAFDGNCFIDYKGVLYMSQASKLSSYSYGGASFTADVNSGSYVVVCQGVVHPADGFLYLATASAIISYDGSSWTAAAFTLPDTNFSIVKIAVYGNFLAIQCRNSSSKQTRVLLWNRDTSVNTVSENIEWGDEAPAILESYGGYLIGIGSYGASSSAFKDRMVFRYYGGGAPFGEKFMELTVDGTTLVLGKYQQKSTNRIYFAAQATINGEAFSGIWTLGKTAINEPFSVVLDRLANNDTAVTNLNGFLLTSDYMYISYITSGTYGMSKTDDQANFTATSIYESTINPEQPERLRGSAGTKTNQKQLVATALATTPLTSGQQTVQKYKIDGGSWQTIATVTNAVTADTVVAERTFDANSKQFQNGREYEFRLESTGGAEITEFKYKYEVLETKI